MIVSIDDLRHAQLDDPEQFANGETTPLTLVAAEGTVFSPDVASLALALYDSTGNLLALSSAFVSAGGGKYTGTIDCKNEGIVNMFTGQPIAYRAPVNLAVVDTNRVWAIQYAEMTNNPLVMPPIAPNPALVYLTTSDFKNLTVPQIGDSFDSWVAYMRAVGLILQGS